MKIHYLISNGGDGSVSLQLYESAELANFMEEVVYAGTENNWAEPSYGFIELESDCDITIKTNKEIKTKESLLVNFYKGYLNERFLEEFVEEFFSERFPIFEVKDIERKEVNAYDYKTNKQKLTVFYHYHLYADGKFVDKIYKDTNNLTKQELVNEIYNKLNSYLN